MLAEQKDIPSGGLQLEAAHPGNEGGKAGQSLLAAAPHTNQHGTASRLGQDPSNAADVLYGIWEQYCKHKYIYVSCRLRGLW